MAESLPLIPEKGGALCADVRPVLREVFQELDYLPPLAPRRTSPSPGDEGSCHSRLPALHQWVDKYDTDRKDIWQREGELKEQYAKRISREPLPNIYQLQPAAKKKSVASRWRREQGIISREDLMPSIVQNSNVGGTLWVQNILNRSSGDLTPMMVHGTKLNSPVRLSSPKESSLQSVSTGDVRLQVEEPGAVRPPPPPAPEHILCVPPELDFVNFTVGKLHTQTIRLVNVSKLEVRLSVRPPTSRQLDVELCGPRGLTVTSGAAAEIKLNFRAQDVRVLRDELLVRVSSGQLLRVPITCYMQPPILHILVPAVSPSLLSCTALVESSVPTSSDCVELGARLLGDVHCVSLVLYCAAEHASFFLLPEDAWLNFSLDAVTSLGSVVAAPFVVWPAWWRGGGTVRARVWCRAPSAGLHAAALRLVASTAVVRPLHLIADALHFRPEHITLQAQEKDYDICSDGDAACEYYVHLGTAFPHRPLSATVQLINHSPIVYQYYWSVRPWGTCSCWEEEREKRKQREERQRERRERSEEGVEWCSEEGSESLCVGAKEARDKELTAGPPDPCQPTSASRVRVEPALGCMAARSTRTVHVCAPDVGDELGVQRAVLMLILKGIPKESLPNDYDPMIVKTDIIESDPMPGVKCWIRESYEIVCTQMEVWWEVAPVRFVLDPPILHLEYSRRLTELKVQVRGTQLFDCESIECEWRVPRHVAPQPAPIALTAAHSCPAELDYGLPLLPNHFPETDVITLEAARAEWCASSSVRRRCATRHPALRPASHWLGVVPPSAAVRAHLHLHNDTYQHICWWATPFRWYGENPPSAACGPAGGAAREPCSRCQERACTCAIIRPSRGALDHGQGTNIVYSVHAPEHDGVVATLVRAQRTSADVAHVAHGAGSEARAALLAYRVLAPRLVLRALPCRGAAGGHPHCACSAPDAGAARSARGAATLRPCAALPLGHSACYRLRLTNTTPLLAAVCWEPPLDEEYLKIHFNPKEFNVEGFAEIEIQVVLEARRVCGRRLFLRRARVQHAHAPLYLVIDAAVSGLEIVCEVPLGGGENTETTVTMRRTQPELYPWEAARSLPRTFEEVFAAEDRKRALRAENVCRCKCELVYIPPPPPRPRPPPKDDDDYPPIEIVSEPPPRTRVCACRPGAPPALPHLADGYCLQFHKLPLRTVRTRRLVLRNESALEATWSATVRNWPRVHRRTLNEEQWAGDVRAPGVCVEVAPRAGRLPPRCSLDLRVSVYADCWGLYQDQLAIKFENLEAIVLDLWIEAVGPPLQFALQPLEAHSPVLCWMSAAQPARALRVKNVSRSELAVHAYLCTEHEHAHQALPFRLYYRLVGELPARCRCMDGPEEQSMTSSSVEELETGVELYLAPDCGLQSDAHYSVFPETTHVSPGAWSTWSVELKVPPHAEVAPPSTLLLRTLPLNNVGTGWARLVPPPQAVRLRHAPREGILLTSCCELRARICALDLPQGDVLRIRKRFQVQNVGNGPLEMRARTEPPWSILLQQDGCGAGCRCNAARELDVALLLMPRSSQEMCVEVRVNTVEATPAAPPPLADATPCVPLAPPASSPYPPRCETRTRLHFYDEDNVLKTMSLVLEVEYPVLSLEPASIEFGFVTDGDTRKSYYSITHTSPTAVLELWTEWLGGEGFRLHPRCFTLRPGARERIYIQYTAKWCGAPAEGWCAVRAAGGAGAWCRCAGAARASPARDLARRAAPRDPTDDTVLLPPAPTHRAPLCL